MLNWGFYLTAYSLAFKVLLGVFTFCMVLSLYLKIRIIHEKQGYKIWEERYFMRVLGFVGIATVLNLVFVSYLNVNWSKAYSANMAGDNLGHFLFE